MGSLHVRPRVLAHLIRCLKTVEADEAMIAISDPVIRVERLIDVRPGEVFSFLGAARWAASRS